MKLDHLGAILTQLKKEIHCPKCKNTFQGPEIEVVSMVGNTIEFQSNCRVCQSQSTIMATIEIVPQKIIPTTPIPPKVLSPEAVRGISQKIKKLEGSVFELFHK